jgi:hypothetical protein
MSLTSNDELHLKNMVTSIFNVEVFPHVCSFYHGFGHLLASYPYRSSQVEVQPILLTTLPLVNLPIALVPSYPNTLLRNSGSHPGIRGDRGEFP